MKRFFKAIIQTLFFLITGFIAHKAVIYFQPSLKTQGIIIGALTIILVFIAYLRENLDKQ